MKYEKNIEKLLSHFKTTNAGLEKILGLSNGYIANIGKKETDNPGKLLVGLTEQGISSDWFLTGKGEMLLSEKTKNPPLLEELEAIIDKRVDTRLAEIENRLQKAGVSPQEKPNSGLYVSEPEPKYGVAHKKIQFVDDIAAGPPIQQSEDLSEYIDVPERFIKTKPEDYYTAHIRGESMTAAGIPDGCTVLIRRSDVPRDGAIQVVRRGGKSTLKRMREIPGKGWKICFEDYTRRFIEIDPGDEFHIQGDFIAVLPEDE
jgi:SOS-response transcriptional repressor LexA